MFIVRLVTSLIYYLYVSLLNLYSPAESIVYVSEHDEKSALDELKPPPRTCLHGDIQTVFSYYVWEHCLRYFYDTSCVREGNDTAAILVCGYTGSETSHYIRMFNAWVARKKHVDTFVVKRNYTVKQYSDFDDIEEHVNNIASHYKKVWVIGFSAGSISVIHYASKVQNPPKNVSCVTIGAAYNLHLFKKNVPKIWSELLASFAKEKKPDGKLYTCVIELDTAVAARRGELFDTYYGRNSCHELLLHCKIPLITLNALDDPLLCNRNMFLSIEASGINDKVRTVITTVGGHLGFDFGRWLCCEFFEKVI